MTAEKREYAQMLGLLSGEERTEEEKADKRVALQYIMLGADIPKSLLWKLERYQRIGMD
ncbi:MAG: hypothetical protein K6G04_02780 [Lachnospiraceae bacterium]|nr:hypothetical protein [Lachnospiraceae bacterium]